MSLAACASLACFSKVTLTGSSASAATSPAIGMIATFNDQADRYPGSLRIVFH
jgi:hypothetical protein